MPAGKTAQRCLLVEREVVHVHARVGGAALGEVVEELGEGDLLLGLVRRPYSAVLIRVRFDIAEQELQAPLETVLLHPERVTREDEEDVTRSGVGQRGERRGHV